MSSSPKKEKESISLLSQTKARFDAVLRSAVRKSDAAKASITTSSLKRSSRDPSDPNAFSSQQNLIDESPDQEIPTLELFKQKKSKSRTTDDNETSFVTKTPSHSSKKSQSNDFFESSSSSRKPSTIISASRSKSNKAVLKHGRNNSSSFESNDESSSDEQSQINRKDSNNIPTASFVDDNHDTEPEEEHELPKPKPLPRRKSFMVNDSMELPLEKPVPKTRQIYSRKNSSDDNKIELTKNESRSKRSVKVDHPDLKSKWMFQAAKAITKINPWTKSVGPQHRSKSRKKRELLGTDSTPIRKSGKNFGTKDSEKDDDEVVEGRSYKKVVGIIVHNMSWLGRSLSKGFLLRPFVRVSIYKTTMNKPLHDPMKSQHFNCLSKEITPKWEELLVFPIDYDTIEDKNTVLFFEIFDMKVGFKRSQDVEHCLAWAFLKPIGVNGMNNTHNKLQLQLYKPKTDVRETEGIHVFDWWSSTRRKKYPGTLYVTVKSKHRKKSDLKPASEEKQQERSKSHNDLTNERTKKIAKEEPRTYSWSRTSGQVCKLPNCRLVKLPTLDKGSLSIRFNHAGDLLACACADTFNINVYDIPGGTFRFELTGHQGLVYDMCWTHNDMKLLSASSDRTVCIWDMIEGNLSQLLSHPSFVYACDVTVSSRLAVSGCFDRIVRIWQLALDPMSFSEPPSYELYQELPDEHKGYITAVCFGSDSRTVYSGDSAGIINEWSRTSEDFWQWTRHMCPELNAVVNRLCLHPSGERLLVHVRDNILRIIHVERATVVRLLKGATNFRIQTSACFSPCGNLVLGGSEDGLVTVWDTDSGHRIAVYKFPWIPVQHADQEKNDEPITAMAAVDYHPKGHAAAFCAYGFSTSVYVCKYDRNADSNVIGLTLFKERYKESEFNSNASEISLNQQPVQSEEKQKTHKRSTESDAIYQKHNGTSNDDLIKPSTSRAGQDGIKLSALIRKIDNILSPIKRTISKPQSPDGLIDTRFMNTLSEMKSQKLKKQPKNTRQEPVNEIVVIGEPHQPPMQPGRSLNKNHNLENNKTNFNTAISQDSLMTSNRNHEDSSTAASDDETITSRNEASNANNRTYSIQNNFEEDLVQSSSFAESLVTDEDSNNDSPRARRRKQISGKKVVSHKGKRWK
ncbi:jouberin-like [Ctenocephalides felis]|uniref:jouberin-like n=1 Tax=Ctenocephalides felis TaxID=7515 RepID=UPI000E6E5147|nr:jouberin-like [Ctenocephalides felis]